MLINAAIIAAKTPAGKKIIVEIGIPLLKKASTIAMKFIQEGVEAVKDKQMQEERIKLSKPLDIVDNSLNIPTSFVENQLKPFVKNIDNDINTLKGQNEMLFLSNSISYFIDAHSARTGLDRSISHALQCDIAAVRSHLNKSRDIRFPGYLLHQCASLAETVKELNIFYVAILSNGKVPEFTSEFVYDELSKRFGAVQRQGDIRSYMPYEFQLPFMRNCAEYKKKKMSTLIKIFGDNKEFNFSEINDKAHESLFVLGEELIANEELEYKVNSLIQLFPEKRLLVESEKIQ